MNLVNFDYVSQKDKELTKLFIESNHLKKYILGINKFTKSILKHLNVDGIIDDFSRVQRSRKKEILKINEVDKNSIILSVSTGSPLEVKNKLDQLGFTNFNYLGFFKHSPFDLAPPPFMIDFEENFKNNYSKYNDIYNLLEDLKSKNTFEKIINFKITYDLDFMQGFQNITHLQYFDNLILPNIKNITFVDGGGYVGDTCSQVVKNYPDYKKIYLIEPIAENLRIAKRDLGYLENIEFIECGLYNKKERLLFNEEKSFSSMYGKGTQKVDVDTLDNIIKEKVDYIKLDIEGAEQDAIEGAKNTIQKYKPVLAICIYHKAEDWYEIPKKVLAIESGYKIYIRHYMEGIFETVMYFIPKTIN